MVTCPSSIANGGVTRTEIFGWTPTVSPARIARAASPSLSTLMVAPALTAASSSISQLAGAGEVDRNSGQLGMLEALQLAERDDAEPVDISSKEFEQWLIRVCSH